METGVEASKDDELFAFLEKQFTRTEAEASAENELFEFLEADFAGTEDAALPDDGPLAVPETEFRLTEYERNYAETMMSEWCGHRFMELSDIDMAWWMGDIRPAEAAAAPKVGRAALTLAG